VSVWAIIPAAGRGSRLGAASPKQFLPLAGRPILARTLAVFDVSPAVDHVVVVVPPGDEARCRAIAVEPYGLTKVRAVVAGGDLRQESVVRGLDAIEKAASIVVVHDAARPLVTGDLVRRVIEAAAVSGAAVAALPVVDTLKRQSGRDGAVTTVDREGLWTAQTPQAFRAATFREAVRRAEADGFVGTDDAGLVERLGHPVALVEGERFNFKITRAEDIAFAEELLAMVRVRSRDASPDFPVRSGSA
jgi:2-C-methyl-D-erythritol 4-phosphate cytidylyltransferase